MPLDFENFEVKTSRQRTKSGVMLYLSEEQRSYLLDRVHEIREKGRKCSLTEYIRALIDQEMPEEKRTRY